jgi:hypothetical protein
LNIFNIKYIFILWVIKPTLPFCKIIEFSNKSKKLSYLRISNFLQHRLSTLDPFQIQPLHTSSQVSLSYVLDIMSITRSVSEILHPQACPGWIQELWCHTLTSMTMVEVAKKKMTLYLGIQKNIYKINSIQIWLKFLQITTTTTWTSSRPSNKS